MKTITKTGNAKTDKVRAFLNDLFNDVTGSTERFKTSLSLDEKEIIFTFTDDNLIGSFHLQDLSNQPIADATQLSLPLFAQEGGER